MGGLQRHEATWTHPATRHALFYRTWQPLDTQAVIVIVHGFGEHGGRYDELAQALAVHGLATCCLDLYGHGRSAGPRGDVATCADYVEDLEGFVAHIDALAPSAAFGHSAGGLIATSWALRRPPWMRCLILQSPLFGVGFAVPAWKEALARWLGRCWPTAALPMDLDPSRLSRDQAIGRQYRQDPLVHNRITARAYAAMQQMMRQVREQAAQLTVPTLMLYGTEDAIVSLPACQDFFTRLTAPKQLVTFPGAYHELHHDSVQSQVVERMTQWVRQHV